MTRPKIKTKMSEITPSSEQPMKAKTGKILQKKETDDSIIDTANGAWSLAPKTGFQQAALTHLMRQVLQETELVPDSEGETQTVAQGFVKDVVKLARRGNPTAITQVFERMDGKVPNTSVSVTASFTDDERVSRILGLIKQRGTQASTGADDADGESGA